jgi:hypothetical protein
VSDIAKILPADGKLQIRLHPKQAICGRGWILFLDEAECRLWSRDFVAARKGILQPQRPELEAAPGLNYRMARKTAETDPKSNQVRSQK